MAQRAVTMGMSALASSAVELEAHQIEVVRRILQDPVQRYLLADEVGLGKTIEAGILIRQCVLDCGDDALILVIVPDELVAQWRGELDSRFFLGHCLDVRIHVVPFTDHGRIRPLLSRATMLVIDEAHHLTGKCAVGDGTLYAELATAAPTIERLLLLSATPALHNERGFLEMLHLLDPDTYPLNDESGFRRRIDSRQMLAQIVAGLVPENILYLDHTLDQLTEHFSDDHLLQDHVVALRSIAYALPDETDPELIDAIARVRAHISEVYRLHRRILRHRRRNIIGLTPDRSGAIRVDYESSASARLYKAAEVWRFEQTTIVDAEPALSDRLRVFFQTLDRMQQYACSGAGNIGILARQSELVGDRHFAAVVQILSSEEAFEDRASALVASIKALLTPRQQFVVFCSDIETADRLAKTLSINLGVPVDRHDPGHDNWMAFNRDSARPILVCDRRAEEGLNLQGGRKIVVHYDLPFNPNRIEQRLGRVDRYGSGDAVRSIILTCRDNFYETAWVSYLDTALRLFDRSIASLQYLIEETARTLASALFREGPEAIIDLESASRGKDGSIAREITALDQQDALDALSAPSSDTLDALSDIDEAWREIDAASSGWIETNLMFSRIPGQGSHEQHASGTLPFCYRYETQRAHTLIPLETFLIRCSPAIDSSVQAMLTRAVKTYPVTYRRRTALGREGMAAHARLLRYGETFIDGMWDLSQNDDRGRSTALWRYFPGHQSEGAVDVFFRFDFIVEPDLAGACAVLSAADRLNVAGRAAVARRGDMALPPFFQTIWIDQESDEVTDKALLEKLDLAYRPTAMGQGGRDFNLNPKRWGKLGRLRLPQMTDWPAMCGQARKHAEMILRKSPVFVESLSTARHRAVAVDHGRLGQLRARADRRNDPVDEAEWRIEHDLADAINSGIIAPSVRVDAIIACFLTGDLTLTAKLDERS
ncbi:hypothetical protein CKO16_19595 [Rhodoblastus acidophilus]|nr:hypothetical protein CKO16_19595 [Rhodoblastus acidophilus]